MPEASARWSCRQQALAPWHHVGMVEQAQVKLSGDINGGRVLTGRRASGELSLVLDT